MRELKNLRKRSRFCWHVLSRFRWQKPTSLVGSRRVHCQVCEQKWSSHQMHQMRSFFCQNVEVCLTLWVLTPFQVFLVEIQVSRSPMHEHRVRLHRHNDNLFFDSRVCIQIDAVRRSSHFSSLLSGNLIGPCTRVVFQSCHYCTRHCV